MGKEKNKHKNRVLKVRRIEEENNYNKIEQENPDEQKNKHDINDTDKLTKVRIRRIENKEEKIKSSRDDILNEISINKKLSKDSFLIKSKNRSRIVVQEYVDYLLENERIICFNEELYKYDNCKGYYKILNQHDFGVLIYQYMKPEHRRLIVDYDIGAMYRIMKIQPEIQVNMEEIDSNDMLINCNNCVFNLEDGKAYEHSPNRIFFNSINASFNKDIKLDEFEKSRFNKFINKMTNKNEELKMLIQEIFGYSISSMNNAKKFFLFYGVPNSGKSTILDILNHIVGEENCSHIPLQKLVDDKYCAELFGKLLNTYNELSDDALKDLAQIKGLVSSNDKITARKLYNAPFSFKNKSTLIFACNNLPEVETKLYQDNSAIFKRMIIVPFLLSISEEKQDKNLFEKLVRESDIIFLWSLMGAKRFVENGFNFSECELSNKFLKDYMEEEDLIGAFIKKIQYRQEEYVFWDEIKMKFKEFAKENGRSFITAKELKFLKSCIEKRFEVIAKKVHRGNQNKLGFNNIILT